MRRTSSGARGVEGGDGLVGDDDGGVLDEHAGHGDALLLAAGEEAGADAGAVGDADPVEGRHAEMPLPRPDEGDDGLGEAPASQPSRQDVVQSGEVGDEVELLVDHADLFGKLRAPGAGRARSLPRRRTVPSLGASSPAIMASSVVLPLPLGPRSATASPCSTRSESGRTASIGP